MVRQRLIGLMAAFVLLIASSTTTHAATVYEEGNISSSITTIFGDVMSKVSPFDDYVFFRSGQYEYTMYVGDFTLSGTTFVPSSDVEVYLLSTGSSGYNSVYNYGYTLESGFTLDVGSNLVYSNLGTYPDLIERGDYLDTFTLILVSCAVFMYLVRSIFGFCLRFRG